MTQKTASWPAQGPKKVPKKPVSEALFFHNFRKKTRFFKKRHFSSLFRVLRLEKKEMVFFWKKRQKNTFPTTPFTGNLRNEFVKKGVKSPLFGVPYVPSAHFPENRGQETASFRVCPGSGKVPNSALFGTFRNRVLDPKKQPFFQESGLDPKKCRFLTRFLTPT